MEDKILQAIADLELNLYQKFDVLSSRVHENTQILKTLEHLAQVNKAEHDKISFDLAGISGEIKAMQKDLSAIELVTANNWSNIAQLKSIK